MAKKRRYDEFGYTFLIDPASPAKLKFCTYSGMTYEMEAGTLQECRNEAANRIQRARRMGQPVNVQEAGWEWECETPEEAFLISDSDGFLYIDPDLPQEEPEVEELWNEDDEEWEVAC